MFMEMIEMKINFPEVRKKWNELKGHRGKFFEIITKEVKRVTGNVINDILNSEMAIFLGKPEEIKNKRNGFEERIFGLKGVGAIRIRMPVDRLRKFESTLIPKGERVDPRLKEDMAVLHLAGLSTRTLSMISKRIFQIEIGKDLVSGSMATVREKALKWLERPLDKKYWALYIDGTNFNLQRKGETQKEPTLIVLGVSEDNSKSILSMVPGRKDSAQVWGEVFKDLIKRGLDPSAIKIGIMDGLPGLEAEVKKTFSNALTARCWVHAKKNAVAKCPARLSEAFETFLSKVMYATSKTNAKEAFLRLKSALNGEAERAVGCIEKDLDSLLVHYQFEERFWQALKTTNPIERVNRELKKRSRSMGSMGEETLMCLQVFTALRLEMNWRLTKIDSPKIKNLNQNTKGVRFTNEVEEAFTTLIQ